ncbi:MAG: hypothetical protein DRJ69_01820 [Thermoprotei archaeon]|nr:MAG: hypothetical protein DRJ69_01820 [Thermoprotei archaeon]
MTGGKKPEVTLPFVLMFCLLTLLPLSWAAFTGESLSANSDLKMIKIAAYKATPWSQWGGRIVHIIKDKNGLLNTLSQYDVLILDGYATARMSADEINAVGAWVEDGGVAVLVIRSAIYSYPPGHYKITLTDAEHLDKDTWGGIYNISLAESTTNWVVYRGTGTITLDTTTKVEGTASVKLEGTTTTAGFLGIAFNATTGPLDLSDMAMLKLYVRANATISNVVIQVFDTSGNLRNWRLVPSLEADEWEWICIPLNFTHHTNENPDLSSVAYIEIQVIGSASTAYTIWVDWLHAEKIGGLTEEVAGVVPLGPSVHESVNYAFNIKAGAPDDTFVITKTDLSTIVANMTNIPNTMYRRMPMYPIDDKTSVLLWLKDLSGSRKPCPILTVRQYGGGYAYALLAALPVLVADAPSFHSTTPHRLEDATTGQPWSIMNYLIQNIKDRAGLSEDFRLGLTDKPITVVTVDEGWVRRDVYPGYYNLRNLADEFGFRVTWFVTIGPRFPQWVRYPEQCDAFFANLTAWGHELANHVWNHTRVDENALLVPKHIRKIQSYIKTNYSQVPVGFKAPGYKYNLTNIQTLESMEELEYVALAEGLFGFGLWDEVTSYKVPSGILWGLCNMRYDYAYRLFYLPTSQMPLGSISISEEMEEVLEWAELNGFAPIVWYGHRGHWDDQTDVDRYRQFLTTHLAADDIYMATLKWFVRAYVALATANITVSGSTVIVTGSFGHTDMHYTIAILDMAIASVKVDGVLVNTHNTHLLYVPGGASRVEISLGTEPTKPYLLWGNYIQTGWAQILGASWSEATKSMTVEVDVPKDRLLILKVAVDSMPTNISIGGTTYVSVPTKDDFDRATTNCWYYDSTNKLIYIKARGHSPVEITISWATGMPPPPSGEEEETSTTWPQLPAMRPEYLLLLIILVAAVMAVLLASRKR